MIVDAVVLLNISNYAQRTSQFASILLGDGLKITESHEVDCDVTFLAALAPEKCRLAQKVDPRLKFMGYALVNYQEIPIAFPASAGDFLWHLRLESPLYSQGHEYSHLSHWTPIDIHISSDLSMEIAVKDTLGASDERDIRRAQEVLVQRIQNLRERLAHCLASSADPLAQQEIGEIIMKTGQLRKLVPDIAALSLKERDSVNFEVMARLVDKFSR